MLVSKIELNLSPSPPTSIATQMFSYVDSKLQWTDLAWIKRVSGLPVVVKGIQTAEDASLAATYGASAIYLSNHGGKDAFYPVSRILPD